AKVSKNGNSIVRKNGTSTRGPTRGISRLPQWRTAFAQPRRTKHSRRASRTSLLYPTDYHYFLLLTLVAPIALFLLDFALGLKSKHYRIQYARSSCLSVPSGATKRDPFMICPVKSMCRTPGFLREDSYHPGSMRTMRASFTTPTAILSSIM